MLIEARQLIPNITASAPPPALNCRIPASGTCCLIGLDGPRLDSYLRALGGIEPSLDGELRLFGIPTAEIPAEQWPSLRMRLAYISRHAPLLSVLNGLENVILPCVYHGKTSRPQAEAQARSLLQTLRFDGDETLLPAYLTPLQRTQLAIARAAMLEPAALLLDEPYHELELQQRGIIDDFLHNWGKEHCLLIATRNLRFVRAYADNILFFADNAIYHFPSWEMLYQSEEVAIRQYLQHYHEHYDL